MPEDHHLLTRCPACHSSRIEPFYEVDAVPVHSVLLLPSREEAISYTRGDIALAFCGSCGFIFNRAFRPEVHEYSDRYDPTQGYSATFNAFHRQLALDLIERYDLQQKEIVEIGCGQGEFLTLLCELGDNRGIGFDPAYVPVREESSAPGRTQFITDFYSKKYADHHADFVCCKMTLEHIGDVAEFVTTVYDAVSARPETIVFFQLPDAERVLRDIAFWDIYYEHCSYFSLGSLARLFRRSGFTVLDAWRGYDDQYLMLVAQPDGNPTAQGPLPEEETVEQLSAHLTHFVDRYPETLSQWRQALRLMYKEGQRVVLWGGGSKAVAFLTSLGVEEEVRYAVDINPRKHGTFIAGTGQEIVGRDFLRSYQPDVVVIMNPIYREEIAADLAEIGLHPRLLTV